MSRSPQDWYAAWKNPSAAPALYDLPDPVQTMAAAQAALDRRNRTDFGPVEEALEPAPPVGCVGSALAAEVGGARPRRAVRRLG